MKKGDVDERQLHETTFKRRIIREDDDESLERASVRGNYEYCLNQDDIADIARLHYNNFKRLGFSSEFAVIGTSSQLGSRIRKFITKTKHLEVARLLLIINLGNLHWVTLMISRQKKGYISYYIDSKNNAPSDEFYAIVNSFGLSLINLRTNHPQQNDLYNSGLWALENTFTLNEMIDENWKLHQVINELEIPRNKDYFNIRRALLANKLRYDTERNLRRTYREDSVSSESSNEGEPTFKKQRTQTVEETKQVLVEVFVEAFISAFMKRLAAYHLAAKGERFTLTALTTELKTGFTGGLLGVGISQSVIGSIPSMVASVRSLSGRYYVPKDEARKITRIFSLIPSAALTPILVEAAISIFQSFESQFLQVTDKAGNKVAMEKLAEDALGRILNYLAKFEENVRVSKELLEKSVLQGPSENFFDPNIRKARIKMVGNTVQDMQGNDINTANLFEEVGVKNTIGAISKFYKLIYRLQGNKYGYRKLFEWELQENGELKKELRERYVEVIIFLEETEFQTNSRNHQFSLQIDSKQQAEAILAKIENRASPANKFSPVEKKSIFFDLREPVSNFVGREKILIDLHTNLKSGRATAITSALSSLSLYTPDKPLGNVLHATVSGLGGIGKTQLVLRYVQLHAADYDNNILWINAATQESINYSFKTLATRLQLAIKDTHNLEKNTEAMVQTVYDYFSDRKSLFIFDNVENFKGIEKFLPRPTPGIKPTLLITSRYSDWKNVASVISLGVFNEAESMALVKKELNISDNSQDVEVKELATLLQGLPLALQQALAYINLQKQVSAAFSIKDYIKLWKEKTSQLLNFNFSDYTNDPYAKTVFTTWQVTLDKINSDPIGKSALEILNIMAYLCQDNISNTLFLKLENVDLAPALQLLRSYSMISVGSERDKTNIHRLVQEVVRINLELDQNKLRDIVRKTENILSDYDFNVENRFHYLHFLLYMTEHTELRPTLQIDLASRELFRILPYHDTKYWLYFLDLAYIKFSKERYLKFLSEAIIYYARMPSFLFLSETLDYIEKKLEEGALAKENIKYILERRYHPTNPYYKIFNYSPIQLEKQEEQHSALALIYSLKEKLFKNDEEYLQCVGHFSRKRSVNPCRLTEPDKKSVEKIDVSATESNLKKVTRLSDWASSSLISKDILASIMQGEYKSVAIDFSLIGSTIILGKISNQLLLQGDSLLENSFLFTKNLELKDKSALKILLDKEVAPTLKNRFFGQALKIASPFVARGTVLLFAYNLVNEIQEYQRGNKMLLGDIISNGAIVGLEGMEAGVEAAEFLEVIVGISEFTGPITAAAAALIWFGAEAYHANKQLDVIEMQVHLSLVEKLKQSLRAFFYFSPSEYLEVKAANNQMLKKVLSFLKNHTEIKRYIFPAFSSPNALHKKNQVFLEQKRKFIISDTMPDTLQEGDLFCLSGDESDSIMHWLTSEANTYLCKNAIGFEYSVNRTANITFANLQQGDDVMHAASDMQTLFIVEAGNKNYSGGDNGNLFILQGASISGILQGGNGSDTILLNEFSPQSDYVVHDSRGFLCGKNITDGFYTELFCDMESIELKSIENIYGRKDAADILYVGKYTDFIDGHGGKNKAFPDHFFLTCNSNKNPKIVLRNNTQVLSILNSKLSSVSYNIPVLGSGAAGIKFSFTEMTQHRFFFDCALTDIQTITLDNSTLRFELASRAATNSTMGTFFVTLSDPYFQSSEKTNNTVIPKQAYFFFQGLEVKFLNKDYMYALEYEERDIRNIDERINSLSKLAQRLNKAFIIHLMKYKTVFIGQKKHEVFYTHSDNKNYLVGNVVGNGHDNDDENIYIISAKNASFPLPKVVIYDMFHENLEDFDTLRDTLDLRKVIVSAYQLWPDCLVKLQINPSGLDLILKLKAVKTSNVQLVSIVLKNALFDHWYQKLNVLLNAIPRSIIKAENGNWGLKPIPLTFDSDKEIIVLSQHTLATKIKIFVLKKIGNYLFFRANNNLIITNVFNNPYDRCTVICQQFYTCQIMQKKILSATFVFFDQTLKMQEHLAKINNATLFSEAKQHNSKNFQLNLSDVSSHHAARKRSIDAITSSNINPDELVPNSASRTLPLLQRASNWLQQSKITLGMMLGKAYAKLLTSKAYFIKQNPLIEITPNTNLRWQFESYENDMPCLNNRISKLSFEEKNHSYLEQTSLTKVTAQADLNETLLLSHVMIHSFFNKKTKPIPNFSNQTLKANHFKPSKISENQLTNSTGLKQSLNLSITK